jgi:hypothetical protein
MRNMFDLTSHARIRFFFSLIACICCFFAICFFFKKKKLGRRCWFFFYSVLISYVFLPNIAVHCALIEYAYVWLRIYAWYLQISLLHLNAIYLCTIQSSTKVHFFFFFFFNFLIFSFWKFWWENFFYKMAKLTNSLVEPITYKIWHSF